MNHQKRVLVCTFGAIASGLLGLYLGGRGNLELQTQKCDRGSLNLPGAKNLCQMWVTPFALTDGSITGLWCGMVLGAFFTGLATHQKDEISKEISQDETKN